MSQDTGHFNCRDYDVSLHGVSDGPEVRALPQRHESYEDLERRSRSPAHAKAFPFLRLPLELRQQIYTYLVPGTQELWRPIAASSRARQETTTKAGQANGTAGIDRRLQQDPAHFAVIWHRGCTNLLGVCRQIHDEAAAMMYGNSTFLLFVTYSNITFRFRWMTSGLPPTRSFPFLEMIPKKYLGLIRKIVVHIDHVDSYTGMMKFNVSAKGLVHGLRRQVQKLVSALQPRTAVQVQDGLVFGPSTRLLSKVIIRVSGSNAVLDTIMGLSVRNTAGINDRANDVEEILGPFTDLAGVREVHIAGAITDELAEQLETKMMSTEPRKCHTQCCGGGMADIDQRVPPVCVYGNDID